MEANDTASRMAAATAALAELFDGELRSMGSPDIASLEDRALRRGHEAMARALGSAGRGYEAPHRASVAGLPAGIRYAADVGGGMAAVRG